MTALCRACIGAALALTASAVAAPARAAGTWTKAPANTAAGGQAFGLWVLTDGTVLSHGSALNHWVILVPDKTGSYANGTWKSVASSTHARGGAQQHILKDGRFFQAGGEYIDGPNCTTALCPTAEIYDPVADKWTDVATAPLDIGDTGSATLSDGRILDSTRNGNQTQIYDPSTNKWTMGGANVLTSGDESAWVSLQNGGVLAVGYSKDGAAIYNPATDKWQRTGAVPSGWDTGDTGGISLMFDGRVFVYGLAGKSYIYTPGATAADPGAWANGPAMLDGDEAEDEFSDPLPNGKVWGALVQKTYGPGVVLQEFDPTTNMVSSATPPPDMGNPYPIGYANLPNGQVMATAADANWIYSPDTPPQDVWRPVVSTIAYDSGSTYTLTGIRLSGLINGSDEGDDMTNAQNYPIVWLKDASGDVYYCRSFNFSNMMPSAGNSPETAQFTTPSNLPAGTYDLYVSAVGVVSKDPVKFTTGMGGVGATDGGASNGSGSGTGTGSDAGAASSGDGGSGTGGGGTAGASSGSNAGGSGASGSVAGSGTATTGFVDDGGTRSDASAGEQATAGPSSPSGCACNAIGEKSRHDGLAGLGTVIALAGAIRRRRRRP